MIQQTITISIDLAAKASYAAEEIKSIVAKAIDSLVTHRPSCESEVNISHQNTNLTGTTSFNIESTINTQTSLDFAIVKQLVIMVLKKLIYSTGLQYEIKTTSVKSD